MKVDVSEEHIRYIMLYECNKGNSAAETTQSIKDVYDAESLNDRKCRRWFQKFISGDYSLNDAPRLDHPVECNDGLLLAALDKYRAITVEELEQKLNSTHSTVYCHLQ
ncbi:histone-lysine N-methyltransferase SETMAR-like [Tachypleus tridentatus]|uniref:histone-lysine N-methyltransferase SETMAR-like n=1 Tax=Tachypleus tridentatus TaxID=6853 RepID=UPI003FD3DF70